MELKQIYSTLARFRSRVQVTHVSRCLCSGTTKEAREQEIIIPPRIERGPTDILRALASTVNTDFTAPHYKYHDDPFLIPSSNIGKRTFALAKESGRKAAQWIQHQHPEFFKADIADPAIQALMPKAVYNDDSKVTEQDLLLSIHEVRITDALKVMDLLEKSGQNVSLETRQALLELLCFYNAEDSVPEDLVEERWFRQGQRKERQRKTWRDGGVAEQVFASLEAELEGNKEAQSQLTKAKCTLIKGMAKYCQVDKAWELYQKLKSDGEIVDAATFEALIRGTGFLRDGNEARWQCVLELLQDMAASKIAPDLGTLNAILEILSLSGSSRQSRTSALRTLAEFKLLGIEPSLATYYFLLSIFCRERGPVSSILEEILSEIESKGQPLTIRDPKDTFFFVTAMDVCRNHLGDPSLARRLHALLHKHNNYDLIGDSYKESIYYRHFFVVLCTMEPLDSFLEVYNKYVPNIYIPEPSVMEEVIRSVEMHEAWDLLPRLWADIMVFDQADRESLLILWLSAAVASKAKGVAVDKQVRTPAEIAAIEKTDNFAAALGRAAAQLWEKVESQPSYKTNILRLDGPMLGCIMRLALRAGEFSFACQTLEKLGTIIGTGAPPDIDALREFLQATVERQDTEKAMHCLDFMVEAGFPEAAILANEVRDSLNFSANQISRLDAYFGDQKSRT